MGQTGGCLCGQVEFTAKGPFRPVIACHCGQCRRVTGNFVTATSALRDGVAISGQVTWYQSSATARRGFCATCGSNLFWDGPGVNLSIMAGAFDQPTTLRLAAHIYCADKGDWYDLNDDLPKADHDDPELTTMVVG